MHGRANFVKVTQPPTAATRPARRRSDGERTHSSILEIATQLASVEGIQGVTIGRLADELGVSKSGVYAHFGAKEQLQLETIQAARAIFEREVLTPAFDAPVGLPRLEAVCAAYLSYVERGVFPGGCFFASLLAEMDARSGPLHDAAKTAERDWHHLLIQLAGEAGARHELRDGADTEQVAFQLHAVLDLTNYHYILFRDTHVLERGRAAVAGILAVHRAKKPRGAR